MKSNRIMNLSVRWCVAAAWLMAFIASVSTANADTYTKRLSKIDAAIQADEAYVSQSARSWLHYERLARSYLERAQLSGQYTDYVAAESILKKAFEVAEPGSGPVLLRAKLNYALHRLPAIEADLATAQSALLVNKPTLAKINGIRADVSLQRGQYQEAKHTFDALENTRPGVETAVRLAQYHTQTGQYKRADQWLHTAEQRVVGTQPQLQAWLKLQAGILDLEQGRLNEALVHYNDALQQFPGWWLVQEHIAEIDSLQGRADAAEQSYRSLIERTQSPLFMIALSEILEQRGSKAEASRLLHDATRIYSEQAETTPESIAGHALEHFLQHGSATQALQLAQYNHRLRPAGAPAVLLAHAHAVNGDIWQAAATLDRELATPYRSAELHATASVVYEATGQDMLAEQQRQLALNINPGAIESVDWLQNRIQAIRQN